MRFVPMVAECEWSVPKWEMRQDFDELLAANAPLRVFEFAGAVRPGHPRSGRRRRRQGHPGLHEGLGRSARERYMHGAADITTTLDGLYE